MVNKENLNEEKSTDLKKQVLINDAKNKNIKEVKTFSTNNLPKIFQQTYTQKKLNKIIINKLYIPEDKNYVLNLFKCFDESKQLFAIPKDLIFSKNDFLKLKKLAGQINKQKGRIKLLPLFATIILITGIFLLVNLTKNIIVKLFIVNSMQNIFSAKCDIEKVNVRFLDSSILIKNLSQANKNEPMKNLFETQIINLDFDLQELLKAKIVIDNIECSNIKRNTDRIISGALPEKKKKDNPNSIVNLLKSKVENSIAETKKGIQELFSEYDAENIINALYSELQIPEIVIQVKEEITNFINKWKTKPAEIKTNFEIFSNSASNFKTINIEELKNNPVQLASTIKDVVNTLELGKNLSNEIENIAVQIKQDEQIIQTHSNKIQTAIKNDKNFTQNKISTISSFKIPDGKQIIGNAIDSLGYQYLGKYYPYLEKICDIAKKSKNTSDKTLKKNINTSRAKGRFVYYKKDIVPKFLLRHALFSSDGFYFDAKDISSNMNQYGKPAIINGRLNFANTNHEAKIIADFRDNSTESPITIMYSGDGFSIDYDLNKVVTANGMPNIKGLVSANAILTADEDAQFLFSGQMNLKNVKMTTASFEPEYVSRLYTQALEMIDNIKGNIIAGYSKEENLIFNINSNLESELMNILEKLINQELFVIKNKITEKINSILQEKSADINFSINDFSIIKSNIFDYKDKTNLLINELTMTLNELKNTSENNIKTKVEDTKKQVQEKATDALKGLFKK